MNNDMDVLFGSNSGRNFQLETLTDMNVSRDLLKHISNHNLLNLGKKEFLKLFPYIKKERIYSMILEFNEDDVIEFLDYIPIYYVADMINILSYQKLGTIYRCIN